MEYLHYEFNAGSDQMVEIQLDRQANVLLLDDMNYQCYRRGDSFRYHGGLAKKSPYFLALPRNGRWHLVIDLGGGAGAIRATARLVG